MSLVLTVSQKERDVLLAFVLRLSSYWDFQSAVVTAYMLCVLTQAHREPLQVYSQDFAFYLPNKESAYQWDSRHL